MAGMISTLMALLAIAAVIAGTFLIIHTARAIGRDVAVETIAGVALLESGCTYFWIRSRRHSISQIPAISRQIPLVTRTLEMRSILERNCRNNTGSDCCEWLRGTLTIGWHSAGLKSSLLVVRGISIH
jgi:hypothetical protein